MCELLGGRIQTVSTTLAPSGDAPRHSTAAALRFCAAHLYTSASIADAAKFYDAELKAQGWKIENTTNTGEMFIVSAKKGKTVCGVTVTKEAKRTLVRIAISQAGS